MQFIINDEIDPSFNLAFEEEFFLSDFVFNLPLFYLWRNSRSVIIGVSQIAEHEVNLPYCNENGIPVIRRRTGGGAVFHDLGNLNFTFFFPKKQASNHYRFVFDILNPIFQKLGIEINLSQTNDLLFEDRKFSGMAERRIGEKIMVHGTILYDVDFDVMSKALSTQKSKFIQPKGVASRHAPVINMKDQLKDIPDILSLERYLRKYLIGDDPIFHESISNEFLYRVRQRAEYDYSPLNLKDIKERNGNV